ncbi:MAG: alpha amylase catalytic region [Pedosphaera sp.]|nr:alpha amylase catalytic region [Pedosphaera sp.]
MTHPLLYEVNTRCWLRRLSGEQGRAVTLGNVPDDEFARWQNLGFTHVWAMGVWTTGPRSRALAMESAELRNTFTKILPGWSKHDVPGSPYAIADYAVPAALGGDEGLNIFRHRLNAHGMKLLLDFVPNHVGLDHPWIIERPGLFMHSPFEAPGTFPQKTAAGLRWLAHGRDPHFPPWPDTAQVNYRRPETRAAMIELLRTIARRCDGVRCDMAMLLLNDVFAKTWAHLPEPTKAIASEFWAEAIQAVKQDCPEFIFLAEVYWGLEPRLQSLGFDYTYGKPVYDRLMDRDHVGLQKELLAAPGHVAASAHFLENHDEPRVVSKLSHAEHRMAALLILGLPGMRLLHEGQLHGARLQAPVHLGRWPDEPADAEISTLYESLLAALKDSSVGRGDWRLLSPQSWPDNSSAKNFIVVQWQKAPLEFDLVVVNLAVHPSQCQVRLDIKELAAHDWEMLNQLGRETYQRHGEDLETHGLHLDLPAHGAQLFRFNIQKS